MLDDAAYDGDAAATHGNVSLRQPRILTWTGNLAPGDTATVTFSVTVEQPRHRRQAPDRHRLLRRRRVDLPARHHQPRPAAAPWASSPRRWTSSAPPTPATTVPGATVHYTITITDTGQTPYTGATVADYLTGLLDDAAYNGDAAASTGTVSYASPALTWTGSLAPGDAATVTFSVTVNNPDTGDKILTTTATSAATGNNCPSGSTDPNCATSVPVSVMTITNTASTSTTTPGTTVSYTVTVTNTGQRRPHRHHLHPAAVRCARRRRLQQQRHRHRGPRLVDRPGADLGRRPGPRGSRPPSASRSR